jgi:hypothetical protein
MSFAASELNITLTSVVSVLEATLALRRRSVAAGTDPA